MSQLKNKIIKIEVDKQTYEELTREKAMKNFVKLYSLDALHQASLVVLESNSFPSVVFALKNKITGKTGIINKTDIEVNL